MNFLKILQSRSPGFIVYLVGLSLVNIGCHMGILYLINKTISFDPIPYVQEYSWLVYLGILVISFFVTRAFQIYMIRLANELAYEYTIGIFEKIRDTTYQGVEKLGRERVYAAIDDADLISSFPVEFIAFVNAAIIVMCGIGYMFAESVLSTLLLVGAMFGLAFVYIARNNSIEKHLNQVRDLENHFFDFVNDVLNGFRELKMSSIRNQNLHKKFISKNRKTSRDLKIKTGILYLSNDLSGTYSWYLIIGFILFGIAQFTELGVAGAVSFTFILLYIMGSIAGLIRMIPIFTRVKIANERLVEFHEELKQVDRETYQDKTVAAPIYFESMDIKGLSFEYADSFRKFAVGPIDLQIYQGETVFITGGNGSGKSTFVNLLIGLFQPKSGSVSINGIQADLQTAAYRDHFSVIFTNPYLFQNNYESHRLEERKADIQQRASMLKLEDHLKIDYEKDTIDTQLSQGQKKRLAMILALMEDRPIMVLDEWAAEQDPYFRQEFYQQILPRIKSMGKTLLVITHDDKYFHTADRILTFEYGQITSDQKQFQETYE